MRRMLIDGMPLWLIGGVFLLCMIIIGLQNPHLPKLWVYPLSRDLIETYEVSKLGSLHVQESSHFIIRYREEDAQMVPMITAAAEQAYEPVTTSLGYSPARKSTVVVMSSRREMQKSLGWSAEQSAMGVYWAGMIQVLSPRAWLRGDSLVDQTDDFIRNGPLAHEFTHLVVDAKARGNYPRWFTEGIAQYQEYRLNGYEWITASNTLTRELYTISDLEKNFDDLPNQSLAYRESFAAVRYIYENYGDTSIREILDELNRGKAMPGALKDVLGMDYPQYEEAWQQWAYINMLHPLQ